MPAPSPGERTSACMNIFQATADFERWLPKRLPIVRQDMALKHQQMAEAAFSFFRATFYRWLQLWPNTCPELANAPSVLAVGDLHVENFGTWRDEEGRLIWGVNDLDEAWPCAYTLDLARLTTSAYLAISEEHLSLTRREAAEAVEEGYRDALAAGGKAFVLAEHHQWLRLLALSKLRDPVRFWEKVQQCPPYTAKPPGKARKLIEESLPEPCRHFHGHWLVRRLAPDCSRIELSSLPKERDEARLLYDMGWETANMHFASPQAIAHVKRDLASRRGRWLHKAAKAMYKATLTDWEDWRSSSKNAPKPKKNQN